MSLKLTECSISLFYVFSFSCISYETLQSIFSIIFRCWFWELDLNDYHYLQFETMNPNKPKNWKLIIDPFLIKGSTKLFRYEGQVPGDPTYPVVHLRDPRSQISRIWSRLDVLDLPIPRFRVFYSIIFHYFSSYSILCFWIFVTTDRLGLHWWTSSSWSNHIKRQW